jgi:hypothetical protein
VLKWGSTALCLLIAFAFAFSTRQCITWFSPELRYELHIGLGAISWSWRPEGWRLDNDRYPPRPGWSVARYGGRPSLCWWILSAGNKSWESISVPLWPAFVVVALPAAILWHRDRRNIRATLHRLSLWLTPIRPKKVTFWLVVLFCALHLVSVISGFALFELTYNFFTEYRLGDRLYPILERSLVILIWTTPLWGITWALAWVQLRNRLFRRQPAAHCLACGYDLTGNVSGRCPECGTAISRGGKRA